MKNIINGNVRYAIKFIDPLTGLPDAEFTEITLDNCGLIEMTPEFGPVIESDAIFGKKRNRQKNVHKGEENYSAVAKPDVDSALYEKLWTIHNIDSVSVDLENGLEMKSLRTIDETTGREQHWNKVSISITEFGGEAAASEQVAFTVHIDSNGPVVTDITDISTWPNIAPLP